MAESTDTLHSVTEPSDADRPKSADEAPRPTSNRTLGPYELLRRIGAGGMAEVWVAVRRGGFGFRQTFAVKTIRFDLANSVRLRTMFLAEARLASQVHHTNVLPVLDLGEDQDTVYQAMPLVDGDSVAELVRVLKGRGETLPIAVALRLVLDAARGLHAAHEARDERGVPLQIVHCDVSPHNILVGTDGVGKVSDFGIAKALGGTADGRPGEVRGKRPYLAPEQLVGAFVDRRADVFALGVVLFELTSGERPFSSSRQEGDRAPPVPSAVPRPLARVIECALAHDLAARFPTAEAFGDALEAAAREIEIELSSQEVSRLVMGALAGALERRRSDALADGDPTLVRHDPSAPSVAPPHNVAARPKRRPVVLAMAGASLAMLIGILAIFSHRGTRSRTGEEISAPKNESSELPKASSTTSAALDTAEGPATPSSSVSSAAEKLPAAPPERAQGGRAPLRHVRAKPQGASSLQPKFAKNPYAN